MCACDPNHETHFLPTHRQKVKVPNSFCIIVEMGKLGSLNFTQITNKRVGWK